MGGYGADSPAAAILPHRNRAFAVVRRQSGRAGKSGGRGLGATRGAPAVIVAGSCSAGRDQVALFQSGPAPPAPLAGGYRTGASALAGIVRVRNGLEASSPRCDRGCVAP